MTTRPTSSPSAPHTMNGAPRAASSGTPRTERKSVPISDNVELIEMPPWRRMRASAWMRLKHLVGIHTYLETLRPEMDEDGITLIALRIVTECFVCDEEKP
jgi:hypothetical protein